MSLEDLPADAVALALALNPSEHNKMAIRAESAQWQEGLPPLIVKFDIRRVYTA